MRVLYSGARVFDGSGADPAEADIVVEDGRIVDIGRDLDGDEEVDLAGQTVLPGLFDCHTHVFLSRFDAWKMLQTPFSYRFYEAARNLQATLATGITSIRDAGGADLGIKEAVADGLIAGPRMQISLSMLSQTGGHGDSWFPIGVTVDPIPPHPGVPDTIVDGPDQMRQKVRELIRMGADVLKVATSGGVLSPRDDPRHAHFGPAELAVLVEEATAAGRFVMAHAQATDGIKNAIRAGIRSIEHGIYLDDEAIELMLRHGTWLVPTLLAPQGVVDSADAGVQVPEASLRKAREVIGIHRESFAKAVAAGVRIAMGTDSAVTPHGENLRELPLMAAGGMTPSDVLAATTSSAAELCGVLDERGTLAPGKLADMVAVTGDPYVLDGLRERIAGVWLGGARVA